jgi:predicted O-linked N-acetylglucosamine transferase (SPINDLY family)
MSRHPQSEFWFLKQSKAEKGSDANALTEANIRLQFALWGISPRRIVFVDRIPKEEHIFRCEIMCISYIS